MFNQLISLGLIAQLALDVGETFAVARPGAGEGGRAEAPRAGAPWNKTPWTQ